MKRKDVQALRRLIQYENKPTRQQGKIVSQIGDQAYILLKGSRRIVPATLSPSTPNLGDSAILQRDLRQNQDYAVSSIVSAQQTPASPGFVAATLEANAPTLDIAFDASTYAFLEIDGMFRTDRASNLDSILLALNGDVTTANYYTAAVWVSSSGGPTSAPYSGVAGIALGFISAAATGPAGYYGQVQVRVTCPTGLPKMATFHGGVMNTTTHLYSARGTGVWKNLTDPIVSLRFAPHLGTNIVAGSWVIVRGVR